MLRLRQQIENEAHMFFHINGILVCVFVLPIPNSERMSSRMFAGARMSTVEINVRRFDLDNRIYFTKFSMNLLGAASRFLSRCKQSRETSLAKRQPKFIQRMSD